MISLKGEFLVAMPGMGDERFRDTVDLTSSAMATKARWAWWSTGRSRT